MSNRSKLANAALISNGMVWFGLAVFVAAVAGEQTRSAFSGEWFHMLGWLLLVAAAVGLAVIGVIENRNIRSGKTRPRR